MEPAPAIRRTAEFTQKLSYARTQFNSLYRRYHELTYVRFLHWLDETYGIMIPEIINTNGSIPAYYYVTDEQKYLMFMLKF